MKKYFVLAFVVLSFNTHAQIFSSFNYQPIQFQPQNYSNLQQSIQINAEREQTAFTVCDEVCRMIELYDKQMPAELSGWWNKYKEKVEKPMMDALALGDYDSARQEALKAKRNMPKEVKAVLEQYYKRKEVETPQEWSGTGFALKNRYLVTNYHVIEGATTMKAYGIDGDFSTGYKLTIVGIDKSSDLALLKIGTLTEINPPYNFSYYSLPVGRDVFVLGYPLTQTMGEEVKLTNGIISSTTGYEGDVANYQISVPIQPGNSGGPMFDKNGNLVGIVCAKHAGAENASYAIKTLYLKNLVESVASIDILPSERKLVGRGLSEQATVIKNYVYLIKCSK